MIYYDKHVLIFPMLHKKVGQIRPVYNINMMAPFEKKMWLLFQNTNHQEL